MSDRHQYRLTERQTRIIIMLLGTTDMTFVDIALRARCSRFMIYKINREIGIRPARKDKTLNSVHVESTNA